MNTQMKLIYDNLVIKANAMGYNHAQSDARRILEAPSLGTVTINAKRAAIAFMNDFKHKAKKPTTPRITKPKPRSPQHIDRIMKNWILIYEWAQPLVERTALPREILAAAKENGCTFQVKHIKKICRVISAHKLKEESVVGTL
jgi:hypothetical protein